MLIQPSRLLSQTVVEAPTPESTETRIPSRPRADRDIQLIGVATLPGTATDRSFQNQTGKGDAENRLLGGFSAIASTSRPDQYLLLSDRGPKDGAIDWTCRFHRVHLKIQPETNPAVSAEIVETLFLVDEQGRPFTGLASAYSPTKRRASRLDPEGIRVSQNGNLLISDEYGPRLIEFSPRGRMLGEYEMPQHYRIAHPGLSKKDENPKNKIGRATNRGMEGLALAPADEKLYGLMQSPLLQDSVRDNPAKPYGLHCRLIEFSRDGVALRELVYPLDSKKNKLNEILAVASNHFIVIERDGEAGGEARFKKLMLISLTDATDVSKIDRLPPDTLPVSIRPVRKRVLIDLLDPRWGLAGPHMPEKIEGLAFGPDLKDGRATLIVVSDNDFEPETPSWIYVFAIPREIL